MPTDPRVLTPEDPRLLTPEERERRLRSLQRSLLRAPLRDAMLEAKILEIEFGGAHAPVVVEAWQRVREHHLAFRTAIYRAGLGAPLA